MTTVTETKYVIAVHNLKASAAFYRDILGFTITEISDPGWLFFDKDHCHIMAGECPDAMPAKDTQAHSYFAYMVITDIDSYFQTVSAKGAELINPFRMNPGACGNSESARSMVIASCLEPPSNKAKPVNAPTRMTL